LVQQDVIDFLVVQITALKLWLWLQNFLLNVLNEFFLTLE